jgi:hypothetical protein
MTAMTHIDYPGCERLAWDGPALYAASDTGWCGCLLPHEFFVVGGRRRRTFRHDLLEVKNGAVLVGRSPVPDTGEMLVGYLPFPHLFMWRPDSETEFDPAGEANFVDGKSFYFRDPNRFGDDFMRPPDPPFDNLCRRGVLWDETLVLLPDRREAVLFDLDGHARHAPYALDTGATRLRLDRPSDRGVVQVVSDLDGGWVAMLEGGTLTRLSLEGGEAVLQPTTVRRTDSAVDSCQVADGRVLFVRQDGSATVVDRATNTDLVTLPVGTGPLALSPAGRTVAVAAGDQLNLIPVDRPTAAQTIQVSSGPIRHVAFAPNGLTMAVVTAVGATIFDVG